MCLLDAPMIESVHVYMAAESIIYTSQMYMSVKMRKYRQKCERVLRKV